jgi:hypothetical protein
VVVEAVLSHQDSDTFFVLILSVFSLGILVTRLWMLQGEFIIFSLEFPIFFCDQGSFCSSNMNSYPLMFHILILLATEGGLRVMMRLRGFQRLRVGPVSYYYHPGSSINSETGVNSDSFERENAEAESIPIVFCHGIGVGLIFYMMLIDELMLLGRPLILPEITYVSGFRPWQ